MSATTECDFSFAPHDPYDVPPSLHLLQSVERGSGWRGLDTRSDTSYNLTDVGERWALYVRAVRDGTVADQRPTLPRRDWPIDMWLSLLLPSRRRAVWACIPRPS